MSRLDIELEFGYHYAIRKRSIVKYTVKSALSDIRGISDSLKAQSKDTSASLRDRADAHKRHVALKSSLAAFRNKRPLHVRQIIDTLEAQSKYAGSFTSDETLTLLERHESELHADALRRAAAHVLFAFASAESLNEDDA